MTAASTLLGRWAYRLWFKPRSAVLRRNREGWINIFLAERGMRQMKVAAARLPATPEPRADAPEVYFLTGEKFWYQTVFCAYSLVSHCPQPPRFVILDDGSLTSDRVAQLRSILTGCRVLAAAEIEARLDVHLPFEKFRVLRQRRLEYPHLRKLTDIHAGTQGWKLVLDSDMLFHRRPDVLLRWLATPDAPIHMTDIENAYGYSISLMQRLSGHPIPDRINVGICGLDSDAIDWTRLEKWCGELMRLEGSHYLQEQALAAMLISQWRHIAVSPADAIVAPSPEECRAPSVCLHHYVAESKTFYFRTAWRRIAERVD